MPTELDHDKIDLAGFPDPGHHVVYELWRNDAPFYVGVSSDLMSRVAQHRKTRDWIDSVVWREYETREEANDEEGRRIGQLSIDYELENIMLNTR